MNIPGAFYWASDSLTVFGVQKKRKECNAFSASHGTQPRFPLTSHRCPESTTFYAPPSASGAWRHSEWRRAAEKGTSPVSPAGGWIWENRVKRPELVSKVFRISALRHPIVTLNSAYLLCSWWWKCFSLESFCNKHVSADLLVSTLFVEGFSLQIYKRTKVTNERKKNNKKPHPIITNERVITHCHLSTVQRAQSNIYSYTIPDQPVLPETSYSWRLIKEKKKRLPSLIKIYFLSLSLHIWDSPVLNWTLIKCVAGILPPQKDQALHQQSSRSHNFVSSSR